MRKWLGYSLRRKLSLLMLLFALIPMLFLGLLAYGISAHLTKKNITQSGFDTLRQMRGNLTSMIEDVEGMSIYLIGQRDIQQYLRLTDPDDRLAADIIGDLGNLAGSKSYISHIAIYAANSSTILSSSSIYNTDFHTPIEVSEVSDKMWAGLYPIKDFSGERNVITFIRPLRSVHDYQLLGWLSVSLDESQVSREWANLQLGGGEGQIRLTDENGNILSASDKSELYLNWEDLHPEVKVYKDTLEYGEALLQQDEEEGGDLSLLYYREPLNGWTLLATLPSSWASTQSSIILHLTAAAVVLVIVLSGALTFFVLNRVTKPLALLSRLLTMVNPERPMPVFPMNTNDEIARLGQSYNMLGKHIEQLKKQLIQNETRKKEADMQALQAQINPHFLYNTLSSIRWMALMKRDQAIAQMVGSLSDFLRFSLNNGRDYCTVHQELAHIRNYEQVQSIRYPGKFALELVVDARLQERYMLKLLLQPLVENSMLHGILKKEGKGTITVIVEEQDKHMVFTVMDDGVGISEDKLKVLREQIQSGEPNAGFGLRNVNERLLLHYGPDSQLHIISSPGAGTRIRFSIPDRGDPHENNDRG
ncbi:cache domain-containing sensor histidine kinase [Paenibacillus senegalensis]|uniref:cache domain-containing sensor histidine kinase n=1 Tax=Paenibacillus senegalensis TaxID=1465766 RepID=UPI0002884F98|nr:sensor histidine kinase [Paenibacillus senegalensis]